MTNRQYDHNDAVLGDLRDLKTEKIDIEKLRESGPRSKIGQVRKRWCDHLGVDLDEFVAFLVDVQFRTSEAESSWDERSKPLMRSAGLRSDDDAVTAGKAMIRGWVTDGTGPQTRDDIRRQVAEHSLLARKGTLVLAVHAVDQRNTPMQPNVTVDFDLYDGNDSFSRRQLRDPDDWERVVKPAIASAARDLDAYLTRRVHVIGSLRLPVWFAVGRALPDVRGWVLSLDQRDVEWSTAATPADTVARVLVDEPVGPGDDLGLVIALTHDPTSDVRRFLAAGGAPGAHLLTLGPNGETGQTPCRATAGLSRGSALPGRSPAGGPATSALTGFTCSWRPRQVSR